ncbi:MAG: amidase family protein [Myxococcota bacterium]
MTAEWWTLDATAQADLVRSGGISAVELVQGALDRIDANASLNAVVGIDAERALARARAVGTGPFAGVPFLTKDLLPQPGLRAAMGSRLFAGYVPTDPVPYTRCIDEAGLVTLGKTTSSELGLLGSTETALDGTTHNPWGPSWSAGGSSGGAATAVAAGLVPFAHASDGGGSIRIPAALAGLFGFKPSARATAPATPYENPFVALTSEHCISRSVRDSAAFLAATSASPSDRVDPGPVRPLRIGVYTTTAFGEPAAAESCEAVEHAVRVCEALGHHVERVDRLPVSGEAVSRGFFTMAGGAVGAVRDMLAPVLGRPLAPGDVEPFTWALLAWFDGLSEEQRALAFAGLQEQGAAMRGFLERYDVTLCPTIGCARPEIGFLSPELPFDVALRRTEQLAGFTAVHNPAGAPSMSVPLHWTEAGLPVGVLFSASPGADAQLLRLAYQLEEAVPWSDRWARRPGGVA